MSDPLTAGDKLILRLSLALTPSPILLHIQSPLCLISLNPTLSPEQAPLCEDPPPSPPQSPFYWPHALMSGIYCTLVHSSQPVTHALWVDPGRIQFVRYYVLIPVLHSVPPPLPSERGPGRGSLTRMHHSLNHHHHH